MYQSFRFPIEAGLEGVDVEKLRVRWMLTGMRGDGDVARIGGAHGLEIVDVRAEPRVHIADGHANVLTHPPHPEGIDAALGEVFSRTDGQELLAG